MYLINEDSPRFLLVLPCGLFMNTTVEVQYLLKMPLRKHYIVFFGKAQHSRDLTKTNGFLFLVLSEVNKITPYLRPVDQYYGLTDTCSIHFIHRRRG